MTLELVGDANDYVGKGLSGGKVIVRLPHEAPFCRSGQCHYRQRRFLRGDERRGVHSRPRR